MTSARRKCIAGKLQPETIITAHVSADMDALSAMVAAGKLYPDAILVNPPHNEKRLANYFTDSISYFFDFDSPKDCDFSKVKTLVLVDTRQKSRVPHVAEVFNNPGLVIHVYDHHPDAEDDVVADLSVVKPWGSTTAILALALREQKVELLPDEATMLGLGLYEDTGNFTYNSTTQYDLEAAAWLRSLDMDLDVISSLAKHDLTAEQIQILNDLLENAVTHEIKGVSVVITEARLGNYLDDVAELVRRVMDLENIPIIFALVRLGDYIQMIARSNRPDQVDVGGICKAFGGGGHGGAAAASIKHRTINEVKEELNVLLLSNINSIMVADKMTPRPKVLEEGQSIASAEAMMLNYGLKAAPVVADGTMRCVGYLEYQTAARSIGHRLGDQPVSEYMNTKLHTVRGDVIIYAAMEIILSQRQRLVPVLNDAEEVIGVITRTDVVNMMMDDAFRSMKTDNVLIKNKNISDPMYEMLPPQRMKLLERLGSIGDSLSVSVYAVGGFVRDVFLRRRNMDMDLSVEGDGLAFARVLGEELGGRVRIHPKFQTAIVIFKDEQGQEQRIDVATARLEFYDSPGALPTVETSSIKLDLYRRDFSINSMAVQLNPGRFGQVVDFFSGQRDIKEKNIRVMHSLSFIEDPSRVLRAVRFEKRFDFHIVLQTEKLIKNCLRLGMLETFSGSRLFNELKHVFDEQEAVACIRRMEQLNIWVGIHPNLKMNKNKDELVERIEEVLLWHKMLYQQEAPQNWVIYLFGLFHKLKYQDTSQVLERFGFTDKARQRFLGQRELMRQCNPRLEEWSVRSGKMSELYTLLGKIELEGLLFLIAQNTDENVKRGLSHYVSTLRVIRLDIGGQDIINLGVRPGALVGKVLQHVFDAKIDGVISTKEEQVELAGKILVELGGEQPGLLEVLSGRT